MCYSVKLHRDAKFFIDEQSLTVQACLYAKIKILQKYNINLKFPDTRHLKDKIYELREKVENNQYRILYAILSKKIIILLCGFHKKTRETPPEHIKRAEKNLKKCS